MKSSLNQPSGFEEGVTMSGLGHRAKYDLDLYYIVILLIIYAKFYTTGFNNFSKFNVSTFFLHKHSDHSVNQQRLLAFWFWRLWLLKVFITDMKMTANLVIQSEEYECTFCP